MNLVQQLFPLESVNLVELMPTRGRQWLELRVRGICLQQKGLRIGVHSPLQRKRRPDFGHHHVFASGSGAKYCKSVVGLAQNTFMNFLPELTRSCKPLESDRQTFGPL